MKLTSIITSRSLVSVVSVLSLGALGACTQASSSGGGDTAESSVESQEAVEAEGNVMMGALDGADTVSLAPLTGDQIAIRIAANITARWAPSTCVTATTSGSTVHVGYNDCTGPRGMVHVTGELDLAVSVTLAGAITVHGTSDSLRVNQADLAVDATATYSRAGDDRTITVHSMGTGTGARGNAIDHEGDYTVHWNPTTQCGSTVGHWQTDLSGSAGSAERSNDVDISRCATGCPTGTITHHYLRGASLTLTFDGTASATWMASLGGSGKIALACQ